MSRQENSRQHNNRKLFLGVFIPLLAVTFVACTAFAVLALRITNRYVSAETARITGRLADSINLKFVPAITNVEDFAVTAAYTDDGETLNMVIHMMGVSIPYARGIYYGTGASRRNGGVFYDSADWMPPEDWEPSARGWYKEAIAHKGKIAYSVPYVDADTGRLCVGISRQIIGPSGAVTGVVSVDILLHKLTAMIEETTPPSAGGRIYIVNNDGTYLTNPDMSKIMTSSYFDESPIPVKAGDYLTADGTSFQDKTRYYAASKIGESPWYVVVEGPLADFTGRIKRIVYIFEFALVVFCIICSLLNLRNFKAMRRGERETGRQIFTETQNLAISAKQNVATAQDQTAAVKEIVATMEENNALSENIASKIQDVSAVAGKTSGDVSDGVSHLENNVAQLHEIAVANQNTIDGIKVLGDKINNIWDIVTLINSVADQAKIIAFNAELEASSAGEAGKNFHIVATEIRRLADGIIDGTKEIKEKINEIQQSSDRLI
ncbi:MAG: hypothetical protein ILP18_10235, partial [Treponema sp.]|nr:hypothetical protein [Treponema sp.]